MRCIFRAESTTTRSLRRFLSPGGSIFDFVDMRLQVAQSKNFQFSSGKNDEKKLFFNNLLPPKGKNQKSEQNRMVERFCFSPFSTFQPLNQISTNFKFNEVARYRSFHTLHIKIFSFQSVNKCIQADRNMNCSFCAATQLWSAV